MSFSWKLTTYAGEDMQEMIGVVFESLRTQMSYKHQQPVVIRVNGNCDIMTFTDTETSKVSQGFEDKYSNGCGSYMRRVQHFFPIYLIPLFPIFIKKLT